MRQFAQIKKRLLSMTLIGIMTVASLPKITIAEYVPIPDESNNMISHYEEAEILSELQTTASVTESHLLETEAITCEALAETMCMSAAAEWNMEYVTEISTIEEGKDEAGSLEGYPAVEYTTEICTSEECEDETGSLKECPGVEYTTEICTSEECEDETGSLEEYKIEVNTKEEVIFDFDKACKEEIITYLEMLDDESYITFFETLSDAQYNRFWTIACFDFDLTYASDEQIKEFILMFAALEQENLEVSYERYLLCLSDEEYLHVCEVLGDEMPEHARVYIEKDMEKDPNYDLYWNNKETYTTTFGLKQYFTQNVNRAYSNVSQYQFADLINTRFTFIPSQYWRDSNGDGVIELEDAYHADDMQGLFDSFTAMGNNYLYDLDPASAYYVGYMPVNNISTGYNNVAFYLAYNNDYAQMIEGYIYDASTGLLYVPKNIIDGPVANGALEITRIQSIFTFNGNKDTIRIQVPVSVEVQSETAPIGLKDAVFNGTISLNPADNTKAFSFKLFEGDYHKNIYPSHLRLFINGVDMGDHFNYDANTGILESVFPDISLADIHVVIEDVIYPEEYEQIPNIPAVYINISELEKQFSDYGISALEVVNLTGIAAPKEGDTITFERVVLSNYSKASSPYGFGYISSDTAQASSVAAQLNANSRSAMELLNDCNGNSGMLNSSNFHVNANAGGDFTVSGDVLVNGVKFGELSQDYNLHGYCLTIYNSTLSEELVYNYQNGSYNVPATSRVLGTSTLGNTYAWFLSGGHMGADFAFTGATQTQNLIFRLHYDATPKMDPIGMLLKKVDATTGKSVAIKDGSLADAQYTVKYYTEKDTTIPTRTWIFKTDKDGFIFWDPSYLVPGSDELYYNEKGQPAISAGLLTIQETLPSKGYLKDETVYKVNFITNEKGAVYADKSIFNAEKQVDDLTIVSKEQAISGGVKVKKTDTNNAALAGAEFTIYREDGTKATTITSGTDGIAQTGATALTYGFYYIKETKAPTGYNLDTAWKETFEVETNGTIVDLTSRPLVNNSIRGDVKFLKLGENGRRLAGAEITIFDANDVNVMTLTTNENGVAQTTGGALPYGDYYAKETKAPAGFVQNADWKAVFVIREDGVLVDLTDTHTLVNETVRGGVTYKKIDKDLGDTAQGDSTLEGAEITVYAAEEIRTPNGILAAGDVAATLVFGADGIAKTTADALAYGRYTAKETKAPEGYQLNTAWSDTFVVKGRMEDRTAAAYQLAETPVYYELVLKKVDKENGAVPQGDATFEGTVLTVYNSSRNPVVVNQKKYLPGEAVLAVTLDAAGEGATGKVLPYGTYTVKETKAPTGYQLNTDWSETIILYENADDSNVVDIAALDRQLVETAVKGGVIFTKTDRVIKGSAQGDSTLAGAEISIYNASRQAVYVDGIKYKAGECICVLVTNEKGIAQTADDFLPYGTYTAKETKAPEGYLLNTEWNPIFEIHKPGMTDLTETAPLEEDAPKGDLPEFFKIDKDTEDGRPQGEADFAGIQFELKNRSEYAVSIQGKVYQPGDVIATATSDKDGIIIFDTEIGTLPYGTYGMREVKANGKYMLTDTEEKIFSAVLSENGIVTYEPDSITFADEVARGGFHFIKRNTDTKEPIAYIPFSLTNKATGEVHYILTDENGYFSTEANAHSSNTNGNDAVLSKYKTNRDIIPQEVMDSLDKTAGVWFGTTPAKDGQMALPYGTYLLEEMKCESGKSLIMITQEIDIVYTGQDFNFGDVLNDEIRLFTTVRDADSETHYAYASEKTALVDEVVYENVLVGHSYTMHGTLMIVEEDGSVAPVYRANGTVVRVLQEFIPKTRNGVLSMRFEFDARGLEGKKLVVYEEMFSTESGEFAAEHKDVTDERQTIRFPKIATTAKDSETKTGLSRTDADVTITDTVAYENLDPDKTYILSGTLVDRETGKVIVDGEGKEVAASRRFKPDAPNGTIDLTFHLNASYLAGKTTVVFEELTSNGTLLAVHADLRDESQTVYFPSIVTQATDKNGELDHVEALKEATIVDVVRYTALRPGLTYTMRGILMNQATGEPLLVNGEKVTSETTFMAEAETGFVELFFTFDAKAAEGTTVVVFERCYYEEVEVAIHADINDEKQTIYIPKLRTTALAADTNDHVTEADAEVTITDEVFFTGLKTGVSYRVEGVLMDKKTGKALLDIEGNEITARTTFLAKTREGSVTLTFTFDGRLLAGTTAVVFERLYHQNVEVGVHAEIEDEEQTVYIPHIATSAADVVTGFDHTEAFETATIIDTVTYDHLLPGREYTMKGILMDQATGKALLVNGKQVTAEKTFTAEAEEGSVELTFTFNAKAVEGTTVVVFERCYYGDVEVAVHADITDEGQTVYIPKLETTALATDTNDHVTEADAEVTVQDEVFYTGVKIGAEYTVKGILMNKATGEPMLDADGNQITAEETFVAETRNGSIILTFRFDGSLLEGITAVAFETMYHQDVEVGIHAEIEDEEQTVYIPHIATSAADVVTGFDHTEAFETATIIDTVTYDHLLPGREYTMKGILMDQATGKVLLVNGKQVTAEKTFTAEAEEGSVELTFTFDAKAVEGTTVVVFERCYYGDVEVAVHADITDEGQTVYIVKLETTALATDTNDHVTEADAEVTVQDEVFYTGVKIGAEYTVKGILMNKATSEPMLDADGNEITAEETFVAEAQDGSIVLTFTFDGSLLAGTTMVAFETLYHQNVEVGVHAEIDDEAQTVYIPEIHTTALAEDTEDHITMADEMITITDTVYYSHLLAGCEYRMEAVLVDKANGNPIIMNGEPITAETVFIPETEDGTVDVVITIPNAEALAGMTTVVFEKCIHVESDVCVAVHEDVEDAEQTIYIPQIRTQAHDLNTEIDHSAADTMITLVDVVSYNHLIAGKTYTMSGYLVNKADGSVILVDGEPITAETVFTAEESDGTVEVVFIFDASIVKGYPIVVFESCYYNGVEVAAHMDIEDENQTDYIPVIGTTALDDGTLDHITNADDHVVIIDEVRYEGLKPNTRYELFAELMMQSGEPVMLNGEPVINRITFITGDAEEGEVSVSGSVNVELTFDATGMDGESVVVFETLYQSDAVVGEHKDLEDEGQTVHIPEVHTTAVDVATGDHVGSYAEETVIEDEVFYSNLLPGKTYTIFAQLMVKETGEVLADADGNEVTQEVTFTAEEADGSVIVSFTVDTTLLAGQTLVAFENLLYNKVEVAIHADINDEEQTIYIPEIHTTAIDSETGINHSFVGETTVIEDVVHYENLVPGAQYTVSGTLMDQATGEPVVIDGEEVTAQTEFVAETADGDVTVTFEFASAAIAGTTVVVFEELQHNGVIVAIHMDINDGAQTVYIPEIGTTALDEGTEDHITMAGENVVLTDIVTYTGLEAGRTYTMTGTVMVKSTGEALTVNGETVTTSLEFVPEERDGSVELTFTIETLEGLAGESLVVFEELTTEGIPVAAHTDIEDEGQTIHLPDVHTTATDVETGDHAGHLDTETVIEDEVFYSNLLPGKTYTIYAQLMVKETGEVLVDADGNEVTQEVTFTAEEADGSVIVSFTVDTTLLVGQTLVAFETLVYNEVEVAIHADIEDEEQTIYIAEIGTMATAADGSKTLARNTVATVIDVISYHNLIPGKEYKISGQMMNKATNEPIPVTAEMAFVPETADGTVSVAFQVPTTGLDGATLVVFERIYDANNNLIAVHEDIDDVDQTVNVPEEPPVITGDDSTILPQLLTFGLSLFMAALLILVVMVRRKRAA